MARSILSRMKRVWAAASPGTACPSGAVAVVPDTRMRSPIRTARAYPASASHAVPVSMLARVRPPPGRDARAGVGGPEEPGASIPGRDPEWRARQRRLVELRLELVDVLRRHLPGCL